MKKLILILCAIFSISAFAQNREKQKEISAVTFYGVDFSKAKVYGSAESPLEFKAIYYTINQLFITEAKKYDVTKAFKKDVTTNLQEVGDRASKVPTNEIMTPTDAYALSDADIKALIKSFPTQEKTGTGLIFVAELLDKAHNRGHYHIVFFDIATKEIVDTWKADAKARGFGLRNYWARSVYQVMKDVKM